MTVQFSLYYKATSFRWFASYASGFAFAEKGYAYLNPVRVHPLSHPRSRVYIYLAVCTLDEGGGDQERRGAPLLDNER